MKITYQNILSTKISDRFDIGFMKRNENLLHIERINKTVHIHIKSFVLHLKQEQL